MSISRDSCQGTPLCECTSMELKWCPPNALQTILKAGACLVGTQCVILCTPSFAVHGVRSRLFRETAYETIVLPSHDYFSKFADCIFIQRLRLIKSINLMDRDFFCVVHIGTKMMHRAIHVFCLRPILGVSSNFNGARIIFKNRAMNSCFGGFDGHLHSVPP